MDDLGFSAIGDDLQAAVEGPPPDTHWRFADGLGSSSCGDHPVSWESKGAPPMPPPPGNKALLRDY